MYYLEGKIKYNLITINKDNLITINKYKLK